MKPIFDLVRPDPKAPILLERLRQRGIKTAIVSNTPWGSPASAWRRELARHGLLDRVDAVVFCMDVGWRKPHRAPFDRALALLATSPADAVFVGDDPDGTSLGLGMPVYGPCSSGRRRVCRAWKRSRISRTSSGLSTTHPPDERAA
jgi:beta-phosphoglucomutase-like phosphatase (HAD superfamily)